MLAGGLHQAHAAYREAFQSFSHPIWGEIRRRIEAFKPDIVGIHFKTGAIESVRQVARLARDAAPKSLIAAGGPHPSLLPDETIALEEIDVAIRGEGEETLLELANAYPLDGHGPIAGALWREGQGRVVDGGLRPLVGEVDSLGPPDREHLLDREQYSPFAFGTIFTARGCPFGCTYCGSGGIWTRKVRYRTAPIGRGRNPRRGLPVQNALFQLPRRHVYGQSRPHAGDLPPHPRADARESPGGATPAPTASTPSWPRAMRRAGCVQANVGIESGSDRILTMIHKGETRRQIAEGIACLRASRISVSAFIMMGFPTETPEEVEETVAFATSLKPDFLVMSILTPYPGTAIHEQARALGLLPADVPYCDYYHQSPAMGMSTLDSDSFARLQERMLAQVDRYNRNLWRRAAPVRPGLHAKPQSRRREAGQLLLEMTTHPFRLPTPHGVISCLTCCLCAHATVYVEDWVTQQNERRTSLPHRRPLDSGRPIQYAGGRPLHRAFPRASTPVVLPERRPVGSRRPAAASPFYRQGPGAPELDARYGFGASPKR